MRPLLVEVIDKAIGTLKGKVGSKELCGLEAKSMKIRYIRATHQSQK